MADPQDVAFAFDVPWRKPLPVFVTGSGERVVLLLHELPGLTPETIELAHQIALRNYTVYMPLLFGNYGMRRTGLRETIATCRNPLFHCWSTAASSRVAAVAWEIINRIHERQPSSSVAVIGMCLTGNVGVAVLSHPNVASAVMSQPALPFAFGSHARIAATGLSEQELQAANRSGKPVLAFRFTNDCLSPDERMVVFESKLKNIAVETIDSAACNHDGIAPGAHAVLTEAMRWKEPNHPTRRAFDHLIAFLDATVKTK